MDLTTNEKVREFMNECYSQLPSEYAGRDAYMCSMIDCCKNILATDDPRVKELNAEDCRELYEEVTAADRLVEIMDTAPRFKAEHAAERIVALSDIGLRWNDDGISRFDVLDAIAYLEVDLEDRGDEPDDFTDEEKDSVIRPLIMLQERLLELMDDSGSRSELLKLVRQIDQHFALYDTCVQMKIAMY